jgi:selenocysteine lyase/cysteine desulfurase
MAAPAEMDGNVRKYEEIGTHPAANHNAISVALAFHQAIGVERKVARLRYLRDRWAKQVTAGSGHCTMLTPLNSPHTAGIGLVHVEGIDPGALTGWMMTHHRIVVTPINHPEFNGLRVTPNVYTTVQEVDLFAEKLLEAAKKGIA